MGENNLLEKLERLDERVAALEEKAGISVKPPGVIELGLALPEAEIGGLRFNKTEARAVFKRQEDGWYHSRGILFMSARNTRDDNSRDILTEYLQSGPVHKAFLAALGEEGMNIEISLPKENEGIKQYNGVDCWYWLEGKPAASSAYFAAIDYAGDTGDTVASGVGGCAPMFRSTWIKPLHASLYPGLLQRPA
jgi:hypothetical protein